MDAAAVAERLAAWRSNPDNPAARDAAYAAVLRRQMNAAEPPEEPPDVAPREE
jgi:hypothetical protein